MRLDRHVVEEFNASRVELWQQQLAPGDRFTVVIQPGVVFYGIVLAQEPDQEANTRRVKLFCEASPDGVCDIIQVHMVDLPMTRMQFQQARALGWPSHIAILRALVGMGMPATA